jgi:hypothetical protein
MGRIKSVVWFLVIILMYIISIYIYFEIINKIHQFLRDKGIYIEFGHASILLLELGILCLILAIINIIWASVKKYMMLKNKITTP